MEQLVKEETQKRLANQAREARIQRQKQVRQQAIAWTEATRRKFEETKEREIKGLASTVTGQVQNAAIKNIEYLTMKNDLAVAEIGMAHRAAAGFQNVERLKSLKRLKNEEVANNRGSAAMTRHLKQKQAEKSRSMSIVKRKEEVRKAEDKLSKDLISRRPLKVSNSNIEQPEKFGPPEYQQGIAKTLKVASPGKGGKHPLPLRPHANKDHKAKLGTKKTPDKKDGVLASSSSDLAVKSKKKQKSKEGLLKQMARIKASSPSKAGINFEKEEATQDFSKVKDLYGTGYKLRSKYMEAANGTPLHVPTPVQSKVRYFDATIPKGEVKYVAPNGLAVKESRSSPDAWEKGRKTSEESLQQQRSKILKEEEVTQKAKERGKMAMKKAKLEKEILDVRNELLEEIDFPFLGTGSQKAILGLEEDENELASGDPVKRLPENVSSDEFSAVDSEDEEFKFPSRTSDHSHSDLDEGVAPKTIKRLEIPKGAVLRLTESPSSDEFAAVDSDDEDFIFPPRLSSPGHSNIESTEKSDKQHSIPKNLKVPSREQDKLIKSLHPHASKDLKIKTGSKKRSDKKSDAQPSSSADPALKSRKKQRKSKEDLKKSVPSRSTESVSSDEFLAVDPDEEDAAFPSRVSVTKHSSSDERFTRERKMSDSKTGETANLGPSKNQQSIPQTLTEDGVKLSASSRPSDTKDSKGKPSSKRKSDKKDRVQPATSADPSRKQQQKSKENLQKQMVRTPSRASEPSRSNSDERSTLVNLKILEDSQSSSSGSNEISPVNSEEKNTFRSRDSNPSHSDSNERSRSTLVNLKILDDSKSTPSKSNSSVSSNEFSAVDADEEEFTPRSSDSDPRHSNSDLIATRPSKKLKSKIESTEKFPSENQQSIPKNLKVAPTGDDGKLPKSSRSSKDSKSKLGSKKKSDDKDRALAPSSSELAIKSTKSKEKQRRSKESFLDQMVRSLVGVPDPGHLNSDEGSTLVNVKIQDDSKSSSSGSNESSAADSDKRDSASRSRVSNPSHSSTDESSALVNIKILEDSNSTPSGSNEISPEDSEEKEVIFRPRASGPMHSSSDESSVLVNLKIMEDSKSTPSRSDDSSGTDYYSPPDGPFTSTPDGKLHPKSPQRRPSTSESRGLDQLKRSTMYHYLGKFLKRRPDSIEKLPVSSSSSSTIRANSDVLDSESFQYDQSMSSNKSTSASSSSSKKPLSTLREERSDDESGSTIAETSIIAGRIPSTNTTSTTPDSSSRGKDDTSIVIQRSSSSSSEAEIVSSDSLSRLIRALSTHQEIEKEHLEYEDTHYSQELDQSSVGTRQQTSGNNQTHSNVLPLLDSSRDSIPDASAILRRLISRQQAAHNSARSIASSSPKSGPEREAKRVDECLDDITPIKLWETPPRTSLSGANDTEKFSAVFENLIDKWSNMRIEKPPWTPYLDSDEKEEN